MSASRLFTRGLTVFLFHDVTDFPSPFQSAVGVATPLWIFQQQVEWIARTFEVVGTDRLESGQDLPSNAAMLTFDDSWAGTFSNGLPILEKFSLPATAFMNFCGIDERVDATALFHYRNGHDSGFPTMRHRGDQPTVPSGLHDLLRDMDARVDPSREG